LPELAVVLGAFEPDAAEAALEAAGSVGLAGLTLDAGFIALIPAPLGTSEPDGPGTEPAAGAALPAPIFPLSAPDAPELAPLPTEPLPPALAPEPPAPAPPPAPCANAFEVNVAIASDNAAPRTIVGMFFFIDGSP
jgi:hypothetical protein